MFFLVEQAWWYYEVRKGFLRVYTRERLHHGPPSTAYGRWPTTCWGTVSLYAPALVTESTAAMLFPPSPAG